MFVSIVIEFIGVVLCISLSMMELGTKSADLVTHIVTVGFAALALNFVFVLKFLPWCIKSVDLRGHSFSLMLGRWVAWIIEYGSDHRG